MTPKRRALNLSVIFAKNKVSGKLSNPEAAPNTSHVGLLTSRLLALRAP